jgi:hypothetical protein
MGGWPELLPKKPLGEFGLISDVLSGSISGPIDFSGPSSMEEMGILTV